MWKEPKLVIAHCVVQHLLHLHHYRPQDCHLIIKFVARTIRALLQLLKTTCINNLITKRELGNPELDTILLSAVKYFDLQRQLLLPWQPKQISTRLWITHAVEVRIEDYWSDRFSVFEAIVCVVYFDSNDRCEDDAKRRRTALSAASSNHRIMLYPT